CCRSHANALESILSVTSADVDAPVHAVRDNAEAILTWHYEKGARPQLSRLYEKAKTSMWHGETDLPWDTEVDQESVVMANAAATGGFAQGMDVTGTPFASWTDAEWLRLGIESQN